MLYGCIHTHIQTQVTYIHIRTCISMYLCIYLDIYLSIYLSISIYLLSIYLQLVGTLLKSSRRVRPQAPAWAMSRCKEPNDGARLAQSRRWASKGSARSLQRRSRVVLEVGAMIGPMDCIISINKYGVDTRPKVSIRLFSEPEGGTAASF